MKSPLAKINIADIDILNTPPKKLNELIGVVMADYNAQLVTQTVGDEIAFSLETSVLMLKKSSKDDANF